MEDIPSEEIINAVKEVLCQQISLSETDLVRETAKKFGYTRAVGTTESVISYTLKKALTAGLIKNQKAETSPQNNTQTKTTAESFPPSGGFYSYQYFHFSEQSRISTMCL